MDLEQIVKETVAKIVAEKSLTAAEEKKREEIVKAMKKDFKGPAPAMYAIATDKAKKLAEDGDHEVAMAQSSLESIIRNAMELKAKIGDQEIDIPAWIQDHITNSENYIEQASQGYHEYENEDGHEELNEDNLAVKSAAKQIYSVLKQNGVNAKLIASIPGTGYAGKSIGATLTGDSNEALVFYWDDTKTKLTTIEIYLSGDKENVLNFEKKILSSFPGLEQYSRAEYPTPQAFKLNFRVKEKTTAKGGIQELDEEYNFKKSAVESASGDKISNIGYDDMDLPIFFSATDDTISYHLGYGGEFEGKIYKYDGKTGKSIEIGDLKHYGDGQNHPSDDDMHESSQELDEDKMDKEELKQAQIEKAYDQLEKMKANTRLFSKEDIKKAEDRIEKLEAELDALAEKSVNEAFDDFTVRRWQHYAGIK